jgi:hypothetical protein
MKEMTENELVEFIDGIGNYCRKNRLHHACFEFIFAQIGNPLSRKFMMNQLISGKTVKIWNKDEFCERMFDSSLNWYIAHIDTIFGHLSGRVNIVVCLVESPDHDTNITAPVIDAFSRLYEF